MRVIDCDWLIPKVMIGRDEITIKDLLKIAMKIEDRYESLFKTKIYFDLSPASIALGCKYCRFPVNYDAKKIIRKNCKSYKTFQKELYELAKYAELYGWYINRIGETEANIKKFEGKAKENFRYLFQEYLCCDNLPIKIFWSDNTDSYGYGEGFLVFCDDGNDDFYPILIDIMGEDKIKLFIQLFGKRN